MTELLNENTTIRELVAKHPQTRRVFEKLEIDYCCGGERDLRTAAVEKNMASDELLSVLHDAIASPVDQTEIARDWSSLSPTELADYIEQHHHQFVKEQVPRLTDIMAKVVKAHGPKHGSLLLPLQRVFHVLKSDIDEHLFKEEHILFPLIRQIDAYTQGRGPVPESHCGSVENPIHQMRYEHEVVGTALGKMRNLTSNYTSPEVDCNTLRALYEGLAALDADLHEHIHLENNILFPKIVELEKVCVSLCSGL